MRLSGTLEAVFSGKCRRSLRSCFSDGVPSEVASTRPMGEPPMPPLKANFRRGSDKKNVRSTLCGESLHTANGAPAGAMKSSICFFVASLASQSGSRISPVSIPATFMAYLIPTGLPSAKMALIRGKSW